MFPEADPVAVLVRYHTPNYYAAVVAWYYVAPGVAVFLIGQFLISTSRIWFARMGVSLGLRSRLPAWPLSPTADGPAIVVGEVHHPVRAIESPTPEWLMIPERGLSTGVAIFGAVSSGKTSACMHPVARQLLGWQADNPARRPAALVLEVKGDSCHDIRAAGRAQPAPRHRQEHGRIPYHALQLHELQRAQAEPLACISTRIVSVPSSEPQRGGHEGGSAASTPRRCR